LIDRRIIIESLAPLNGRHFHIPDLEAYAEKVTSRGKSISIDDPGLGGPAAYVLFYDDGPTAYVSMTWTHPDRQRSGLMRQLMTQLLREIRKDIRLEVHIDNPARALYEGLGFEQAGRVGNQVAMTRQRRAAVMQPYAFPYLGYLHLIEASDVFIFYDDVHFIQRGWINRNAVLGPNGPQPFAIPVSGGSQNKLIKDVGVCVDDRWLKKFRTRLALNYANAPHRDEVIDLVMSTIATHANGSIADLAIGSIAAVYARLGTPLTVLRSSEVSPETRGLDRSERLALISKDQGASRYVNTPGGRSLYGREDFARYGVRLGFVDSRLVPYPQRPGQDFVAGLSVIDALMFTGSEGVRGLLREFAITWQ
jgi:ribosomal protein S18 acetylase RimI-like enzyme